VSSTTSGSGLVARRFHEATKHSPQSVRSGGHRLDWRNKPKPFKLYEDGEAVDLPRPFPESGVSAVAALQGITSPENAGSPDLAGLGRILAFGSGVLRRVAYGDDETFHFRTYASAGALYPVELYVVNEAVDGLDAGVYHFDPFGFRLIRLREGDHRGVVVEATAGGESTRVSRFIVIFTGLPWRTAWKYTERGYRHLFWDAGMILANVFGLAGSANWPARVVLGFVDAELNGLLGIDGKREFPLCVVTLGCGASNVLPTGAPGPVVLHDFPLSGREIEFEAIKDVTQASSLRTDDEVRAWRSGVTDAIQGQGSDSGRRGDPSFADGNGPEDSIEEVIRRRGSARVFRRASMPLAALGRTLHAATRPILSDYAPSGAVLVEPYLIVNAVEGLAPGAYVYRDDGLVSLREGNFRKEAGYLCLEQRLGADAAATIFLMVDLDFVLAAGGDRGYRLALLEGGIVGGRIYLGAYAHRFGATGLTFYDDLVTEFFSPDAAGKSCLLVVAVGESPRLARLRPQTAGSN
jgi:SagB-type dehydrogenase family enzyme